MWPGRAALVRVIEDIQYVHPKNSSTLPLPHQKQKRSKHLQNNHSEFNQFFQLWSFHPRYFTSFWVIWSSTPCPISEPRPGSCCLFQASAAPPGRIASTKRPRLVESLGFAMVNWGDWSGDWIWPKIWKPGASRVILKMFQICFPSGWFAPDETSKPKSVLSAFQAQHLVLHNHDNQSFSVCHW